MAQAAQLNMGNGIETGSQKECQRCMGRLERIDGTDPDECDELGGFREKFKCQSCANVGTYKFRYTDGKETFTGVCADYADL